MRGDRPRPPGQGSTQQETLRELRRAGWREPLAVTGDGRISLRGRPVAPHHFRVERIYRFEGVTNPDDEGALLALRHEPNDLRGVLVTAYGPEASAEEAAVLRELPPDRPDR